MYCNSNMPIFIFIPKSTLSIIMWFICKLHVEYRETVIIWGLMIQTVNYSRLLLHLHLPPAVHLLDSYHLVSISILCLLVRLAGKGKRCENLNQYILLLARLSCKNWWWKSLKLIAKIMFGIYVFHFYLFIWSSMYQRDFLKRSNDDKG